MNKPLRAGQGENTGLLPCPFCGSTDLTLDNLVDQDDFAVNCNICEVQQIANYTKAQAVALWNKRPAITLAAPDLLAAWERFFAHRTRVFDAQMRGTTKDIPLDAIDKILDDARAALTKATGKANG